MKKLTLATAVALMTIAAPFSASVYANASGKAKACCCKVCKCDNCSCGKGCAKSCGSASACACQQ